MVKRHLLLPRHPVSGENSVRDSRGIHHMENRASGIIMGSSICRNTAPVLGESVLRVIGVWDIWDSLVNDCLVNTAFGIARDSNTRKIQRL